MVNPAPPQCPGFECTLGRTQEWIRNKGRLDGGHTDLPPGHFWYPEGKYLAHVLPGNPGKEDAIRQLYGEYAKTGSLQELAAGRKPVPGAGPLDAPLVVVGEAPGAQEEACGEPFVGPAGMLLQYLFKEAGLPWHLCYRMNVVPWRPPANRKPYPFQVMASYDRIEREIGIISPLRVLAAGSTAWAGVARGEHGTFPDARAAGWISLPGRNYRLAAIYHPSALLRASGAGEREKMQDETLQVLRALMSDG